GKPAIILSVSTIDGISSTAFGAALTEKIDLLEGQLPWGYVLEFATYQPELIEAAVSSAVSNLMQTLVIVLVVVMIFLGFRTGLIVGTFVPVTMLMGVIIMRMLDVELQRVSIAAMIIALGMLVDNGIVVAEDIRVRMAQGVDRTKAAIAAGKSLAVPLLTSSLTTILFFVPMALAEGGTGEYTLSLAQVVAIVLLASWFLAMFMTPAICNWFIKVEVIPAAAEDRFNGLMYDLYRSFLDKVMQFRAAFLGLIVLALLISGYSFKWLDKEFFPLGDRNQFLVYVDLPAGSSVLQTEDVVLRLTEWLSDKEINPEIASNVGYVASGGPRFFLALAAIDPDPHKAFILVNTVNSDVVDEVVARTRQHMLDFFPEAFGDAKKMWMGASEAGLFEVRIIGPDAKILEDASAIVKAKLREMPGILVAKDDWENRVVKLKIEIDQARARRAGVTSQEIAYALNTYLVGTEVTVYREGKDVIPVILRSVEQDRATLTGLQALSVFSKTSNGAIPLNQIADIKGGWEFGRIKRRDQQRTLTVTAKNQTGAGIDIYNYVLPTLENLDLPPGYSWEIGGEIEKQAEANASLFASLPLTVGLIFVLLVWQFNSFRRPAIIMLTIPLVVIGGVLGMFVLKAKFGFMVLLGFFSLAGIILNNGIVLIDRIDAEVKAGKTPAEAIKFACLSRLRPILITTLTTVLGLMPLIISEDPLFYAMASTMAFGLAVGTVFTLGFIPVLYSLFFRVKMS
ncbi:MAG: acriflavine resistance protein B, partial [Sneathiella sp.]